MKALWGHTIFVGSPKHRAEKKGALSPILDSIQEGPAAMLFKSSSLRWGHLSQFR